METQRKMFVSSSNESHVDNKAELRSRNMQLHLADPIEYRRNPFSDRSFGKSEAQRL